MPHAGVASGLVQWSGREYSHQKSISADQANHRPWLMTDLDKSSESNALTTRAQCNISMKCADLMLLHCVVQRTKSL